MNSTLKLVVAGAAVAVVALVGINLLPGNGGVGGSGPGPTATVRATETPTPTPTVATTPSPSASAGGPTTGLPEGPLRAGTYTFTPFAGPDCEVPVAYCSEQPRADSISITVTVPDGWAAIGSAVWVSANLAPDGAALGYGLGAWLLSDPCKVQDPDIRVGPTVADFVDAVAAHPILDTTKPVDVTLAGFSGKAFDLQFPADVSTDAKYNPACPYYRPWEPGIYAQGPNQRWHLWVLDVDGVRVVVQSMDYPGTSAARRAELQAMVDSIKIEP